MKRQAVIFVLVSVLPTVSAARGAEPLRPDADAAALVNAWLGVCSRQAQDYVICPAGKPDNKFRLLPDPVFRHSQPVRGDDIGAVWLWVQEDGRPAVVGSIFAFSTRGGPEGYRSVSHELHSLADEPLVARWRGNSHWSTREPGLTWQPAAGAPVPAASAGPRGRQIGELAGQFRAHEIDPKGGRWELRLVARPIYRYALKKADAVLDGAVLAFCQGTDPEIFVCIEARRTAGGYRWHYAFAAFSDYELHVRHGDAEVWAPPRVVINDRTSPHFLGVMDRTKLPDGPRDSKD